jgi:3-oxoacyl-[acyl-carrier-protein] synthase III
VTIPAGASDQAIPARPRRAALKAIRSHLPERKLTNEALAAEFRDWNVEKIFGKTGISVRSISGPDECASDLGVTAARKLFEAGLLRPEDVDFLIFCTQSPDFFLPASACLMQARLGLPTTCGAIDVNQGCSGFVYGLSLANGLIESGTASNVLLITADTYSKYIEPTDRSVRTIFGDGAAATWIGVTDDAQRRIGPFVLGTDGLGARHLMVRAGASRVPAARADSAGGPATPTLSMNGPEVFTFTLKRVPGVVRQLLERASLTIDDVDLFVFHQANRFMLERLRAKLGIATEKFCINLEAYGNTVSATIPMALEIALASGQARPGDTVMVVGFGVGFSWAASLLRLEEGTTWIGPTS